MKHDDDDNESKEVHRKRAEKKCKSNIYMSKMLLLLNKSMPWTQKKTRKKKFEHKKKTVSKMKMRRKEVEEKEKKGWKFDSNNGFLWTIRSLKDIPPRKWNAATQSLM